MEQLFVIRATLINLLIRHCVDTIEEIFERYVKFQFISKNSALNDLNQIEMSKAMCGDMD